MATKLGRPDSYVSSSRGGQTRLVPNAWNILKRVKHVPALVVRDLSNSRNLASVFELLRLKGVMLLPIGLKARQLR